jgi:hypothetical protein
MKTGGLIFILVNLAMSLGWVVVWSIALIKFYIKG